MREALIQELRRLHTETDQTPTQALMAGQGAYDPELYRHEFGSWEAALREANLDPEALDEERYDHIDELPSDIADTIHDLLDSNDPQRFYRGQLLAELNRLAVELGETPSLPKMKNYGRYSGSSYRNYFGS